MFDGLFEMTCDTWQLFSGHWVDVVIVSVNNVAVTYVLTLGLDGVEE